MKPKTSIIDYRNWVESGPHVANCQPPEHKHGVGYVAPWEDPYAGFPEHCRRSATALASTGIPVHLRSMSEHLINEKSAFRKERTRMQSLLNASIGEYYAQIYQFVPTEAMLARLTSHRWLQGNDLEQINRTRIAYIVLERDRVSDTMATALNKLGQVWVSCKLTLDALIRSGVEEKRVRVIHMPHQPDEPLLALRERERPSDVPRFYHIGKWEPRKAQDKMLLAFMRAFKPRSAKLVLKTGTPFFPYTPGYPMNVGAAVREALQDAQVQANGWTADTLSPSIRIVTDHVTEEDLVKLHTWGDVYLSLSHGEGWDMPAFDAMLAGNQVVYTPSGGPQEFLADGNHLEVPFIGHLPCHPCYQWEPNARYWEYDVDVAADHLRKAALNFSPQRCVAKQGFRTDASRFSPEAVGRQMLECVKELRPSFFKAESAP